MKMQDNFVSRTIKTQKLFNFISGYCYYANIESTIKNQKIYQDSKIKITNDICKQTNNNLIKVTQIKFGNRVIYIEDSYCFRLQHKNPNLNQNHRENSDIGKFILPPTNSSDGSQNNNSIHHNKSSKIMLPKKKLIFKKKNIGQNKQEKNKTKNIAKNFCKAFILYLEEKQQSSLIAKIQHLIDSYKFNNKIIENMLIYPQIKQNFKIFLQEKAELWINSSKKIYDKQIHIKTIKIYLQLIQNGIYFSQSLNKSDQKSIYDSDSQYEGSDQVINHQNSSKK